MMSGKAGHCEVTTPSFATPEPSIFCGDMALRGIYSRRGSVASLAEADRIADACKANMCLQLGAMRPTP